MSRRCPICARSFPAEERFCSIHGLPLVEEIHAQSKEAGALTGHVLDGRYRLAGVAGRGGMAVVYEAEQLRIGRRCAVKVLHPELNADPKMRMRLFREVQATARIRHPNIVEIIDFGDDELAGTYLVMEFLAGRSLAELIHSEAPLPLALIFRIALQLTAGLAATHASGLIHRDLKPSNVRLVADDRVKVLDFGLVKPFEPSAAKDFVTITTGGIAFGTPWYMSPEQAAFQPLDPRTDIYSTGVILYEMLVGRPPFTGDNPLELIDAHRSQPVPLPSKLLESRLTVPPPLEMLILRALEKDPGLRHQSMSELHEALQRVARQTGISVDHEPPRPRTPLKRTLTAEMRHEWTMPLPPSGGVAALQDLKRVIVNRLDEVVARIAPLLQDLIPHYRSVEPEALHRSIGVSLQTALRVLDDPPLTALPPEMRRIADERSGQEFTPTEIIVAVWLALSVVRPVVREVARGNIECYAEIEEQLDRRVLSFVLLLVDYYYSRYHLRLVELNDALSVQNEELLTLRRQLTEQVALTGRQLVDVEQLKARVFEAVSSGLILIEHQTQKVLVFNKAVERVSGVPASQAIGRPISEVLSFIEGVPYEEFVEQASIHGEVGLRKLSIRLPDGAQRAIYVRGQAFVDSAGLRTGTIFVVDDVTEREHIIESFSRYLSRDVVDQVLRRRPALPTGETRRAVLLAVSIHDFRNAIAGLPEAGVVEILTDYVRAVSEAVFHHGGMIDSVVGDGILVYFDQPRDTCAPAVKAAQELHGRLEAINRQRAGHQQPPILVGIGIHSGSVLVANVGDRRRMVRTVVGEAALVAQALQDVARGGEILVSTEVATSVGDGIVLENGPVVPVRGRTQPVEAFRVAFQPEPIVADDVLP